MSNMPQPSDAAIALEKALSFINAANAQIDIVLIEKKATGNEKYFWHMQKKRLNAIVGDVMSRIPSGTARNVIRDDMRDEYGLDAFLSLFFQLNQEGREELERYAKLMVDGFADAGYEPEKNAA